ncbi:unnamed protein product, partial [Iphiclides podalirius]
MCSSEVRHRRARIFECEWRQYLAAGLAFRVGGVPRRTDMDLRLTRARRGARGAGAVFTCGCRRRRAAGGADRCWAGRGGGARGCARGGASRRPPVRLGAASARSSPESGRAAAGVSPRAPGGGGEPRAARLARLDAARSRSVPPHRAPRPAATRRARNHSASAADKAPPPARPPSAPRLRPVFLWARQLDGTVQEVRCEDYDPRNRIRIARTANGWRVIPRTEIYNSIRVPPPPPPPPPARERRDRRGRRRYARSRRRARSPTAAAAAATWQLSPDLETHIPSHTIAVSRAQPPPPTPLDNLLAVAELEFNQQREERLLELDGFLPPEEVARDVMSFELGEPKPPEEMFYERKMPAPGERADDSFPSEIVAHKDLFETISEAHYLPELGGPHDEALLESLVEKGCEDNQILGQALDKLAHLVHGSGDYVDEEGEMLLNDAPVTDIMDRLEHSLAAESPGRSSITAAQGLLHLHHIGDHMPPQEHRQIVEQTFISEEAFNSEQQAECSMETLTASTEIQEASDVNHIGFDHDAEKRLENDVVPNDTMYTEPVPDSNETYIEKAYEEQEPLLPEPTYPHHSELHVPSETPGNHINDDINDHMDVKSLTDEQLSNDEATAPDADVNMSSSSGNFIRTIELPELEDISSNEEMPTDLSIKSMEKKTNPTVVASDAETTNALEDNMSEKSDEQPKDLSVHRRLPTPHASPRRTDIPRAPSRESDAMQSPQPSGIPAIPSSPEIFTMPLTKSKQTLFLETLLSSPSPKMYTSEVTITKQQCEPLNLGKHRKSASPTVSSCSDEMRKLQKEYGEPREKRIKREMIEDHQVRITKVFNKCSEEQIPDLTKAKRPERSAHKTIEETTPLRQLHILKTSAEYNIPDPLLVPKDRLNAILAAPGREIPLLLVQRPELRLPEAFAYPNILQDPDILVVSLSQLETILENDQKKLPSPKPKEAKLAMAKSLVAVNSSSCEKSNTPQPDQTNHPKPIPSMDALAGDIDAATSAALNQMLWLPYLSQLEAMAACSQNMDFLKALNSPGYSGPNYSDLSQMFNPSARFMGPSGFPMVPPMDYDNRMQFAMWQEAMSQANPSAAQRSKPSLEAQMKELSKAGDVQNPYVHSTKSHQSKSHSSARTSPIAHNYNSQRSVPHNPFLQGMYPGMAPSVRPNLPLPGLQIPYFNPGLVGSQRSPRTAQQKSPSSPYYPNNNYLQSVKQSELQSHSRSASSSQESPRPRISVKSLQNLLEPTAAAASGVGTSRRSSTSAALGRRREEPEVGSTTPLGEPPPHLPPHPHDPSSYHLWHPLFGK